VREINIKTSNIGQQQWYISVIPTFRKLRQEDQEFKPSLSNIEDLVSKKSGIYELEKITSI
jgi:hypothetical protein